MAQFTRSVPENIIKPNPEDWGSCLCIKCLNPELKLECIKRTLPNVSITFNDLMDDKKKKYLENLYENIKNSNENYKYQEWGKDIEKGKKGNKVYNAKKKSVQVHQRFFLNYSE